MARLIAITALGLAVAGSVALPAAASTGTARAGATAGSASGWDWFATSNGATTGTHYGDPFASQPAETSASYQGQTWVFGEDPFGNGKTGWIGRKYLKLDSCTSHGCYYNINARNVREWFLPGGPDGP
jgi:hypothetical protein